MKCQEQKRDQFFKSIGNIFITPLPNCKFGTPFPACGKSEPQRFEENEYSLIPLKHKNPAILYLHFILYSYNILIFKYNKNKLHKK